MIVSPLMFNRPFPETLELSWEMVETPPSEQEEDPLGQASVDDVTKYLTRVFQWQQRPTIRQDTDPTSADVTSGVFSGSVW